MKNVEATKTQKLKHKKKYILKIVLVVVGSFILITISAISFAIYKCPLVNIIDFL